MSKPYIFRKLTSYKNTVITKDEEDKLLQLLYSYTNKIIFNREISSDTDRSVSYTHLDVYKRQPSRVPTAFLQASSCASKPTPDSACPAVLTRRYTKVAMAWLSYVVLCCMCL